MGNRKLILGIVAAVVIVGGGIFLYEFFFGATEEASAPISSVAIELTLPAPEPTRQATAEPTAEPTEPPQPAPVAGEATDEAQTEESATAAPTPEPAAIPLPELRVFEISQEGSEVRFTLGEVLQGRPNTVNGITNQLAGQIAVDFNDLSATQLGVILVNARTLATDNEFRNRAIRTRILQTDSYEFITFTPTAVEGLPISVAIGETVTFRVVGDLTIRDISHSVTFEVTASPTSENELTGSATATVLRQDFDLVIPSVEGVADVDEEVMLTIEFVATAVE